MRWVKCSIIVAFLALSSTINICSAVNWRQILAKSAKSVNHVSSQVSSQDGLQDGSQGDSCIWVFFVVAIVLLLGAYIRKYKKKEKWDKSGIADAVMGAVLIASVCYVIVLIAMKGDENAEAKNSLRMEYIKPINKYTEEMFKIEDSLLLAIALRTDSLVRVGAIDSVGAREMYSWVRAQGLKIDSLVRAGVIDGWRTSTRIDTIPQRQEQNK